MDLWKRIFSSPLLWVALVVFVVGNIIFIHLGMLPLFNPDEGRNASIAWDMQQSSSWIIPTYDGVPYMDKPAFFFKWVALSLSVFGHHVFAARLPSALSACVLLLIAFHVCRKEWNNRIASLAIIIIATTPLFFVFARYVIFDMMLALAVSAAIFAGYKAAFSDVKLQHRFYQFTAVAMGVAVLIKGPVGLALPVLVLTIFYRFEGIKGAWKKLLSKRNGLIMALIILPWFLAASYFRHDFPYYGIVRETFLRFTTHQFRRGGPVYYYLPVLFGTFFPWSLLLPGLFFNMARKRYFLTRFDRFLLIWFFVVILFFTLSQSKLPGYILTVSVPSGILIARLFFQAIYEKNPIAIRIIRHGVIALLLIFGSLVFLGACIYFNWDISKHFRVINPHTLIVIQFTFPFCLELFVAITFSGFLFLKTKNIGLAFLTFLIPLMFVPCVILPMLSRIELNRGDNRLASAVTTLAQGNKVVCYRCFPSGLPFYLQKNVIVFTESDGDEIKSNYIPFYLKETHHWPAEIKPLSTFQQWLSKQKKPILVLFPKDQSIQFKNAASHSIVMLPKGYAGMLIQSEVH